VLKGACLQNTGVGKTMAQLARKGPEEVKKSASQLVTRWKESMKSVAPADGNASKRPRHYPPPCSPPPFTPPPPPPPLPTRPPTGKRKITSTKGKACSFLQNDLTLASPIGSCALQVLGGEGHFGSEPGRASCLVA